MTIGLSPDEFLRVQGAAAVAGVPVATFLKWLLREGAAVEGMGGHTTAVLERLDAISVAILRLSSSSEAPPATPTPLVAPREAISARLKDRGLPSSTICQVEAVKDETEGKAAQAAQRS